MRSSHDDATKRLEHGKASEIHAMGTMLGKFYKPNVNFKETGCYVKMHKNEIFYVCSPDGKGREGDETVTTFEFKCPGEKRFTPTMLYKVPTYHIPQILSQMNMIPDGPVAESVFLCWTSESSTAFHVKNDESIWKRIYDELMACYGDKKPIIPTKRSENVIEIKKLIEDFVNENIVSLGEFPSLRSIRCTHHSVQCTPSPKSNLYNAHQNSNHACHNPTLLEMQRVVRATHKVLNDVSTLARPRPTDVLVYILSDLDRIKTSDDTPLAFPLYYGLSGKNLSMETTRNLTQHNMVL